MIYTRLQIALDNKRDEKLVKHFLAVQNEFEGSIKSDAGILRHIMERDRQVSKVFGVGWRWQDVTKTPPYVEKIMSAIKALDGKAIVTVQNEDSSSQTTLTLSEDMFDE